MKTTHRIGTLSFFARDTQSDLVSRSAFVLSRCSGQFRLRASSNSHGINGEMLVLTDDYTRACL